MKKSIMAAFAAIFLGAACVGFAACGAGGPDAKSVEGIEVTEEQWNEAIRYFNRTDAECVIRVSSNETVKEGDKTVNTAGTGEGRVKGGKAYVKRSVKMSGNGIGDGEGYIMSREKADEIEKDVIEYYGLFEDGKNYYYTKNNDGDWGKFSLGGDSYNVAAALLLDGIGGFPRYDDEFECSAEDKGYIVKNSPKKVLKFGKVGDDVRLVAVYQYGEEINGETFSKLEVNCVISYTNVADITLPNVG